MDDVEEKTDSAIADKVWHRNENDPDEEPLNLTQVSLEGGYYNDYPYDNNYSAPGYGHHHDPYSYRPRSTQQNQA